MGKRQGSPLLQELRLSLGTATKGNNPLDLWQLFTHTATCSEAVNVARGYVWILQGAQVRVLLQE